jgi:hypothetical protein
MLISFVRIVDSMGFWSSGLSLKFVEDITHRGDVVIDFGKTSF